MEAITTAMDITSLDIIESENGFLVGGDYGGTAVEVLRSDSGLQCQCFIAQVSHDDCEHIAAVRDYLASIPMSEDRPMLSQADADYYLSKLGALDNTITGNIESANTQIDRIKLWLEMENAKIQRKIDYYTLALDNWMHLMELSTKVLAAGTLKVRAQQPEIVVNDEDAVLKDGRFTRTIPEKQAIDKAALRKYVLDTGEELEGIQVILKQHKFSYKLNPGGSS
jgi:hypothetical protein